MLENRGSTDSHIIAYRPDLDGLRAIAVLSVIVYHLSANMLPGGFLGVDIFFVLSGYLITSIIWREVSVGDFSLVRFYDRRIRRLMPALLTVLFATTIASGLLLLPIDLVGFARSLLAALGFVANVYFWRDTDYFSRMAEEKPLLHIWSLGVEEQFYVLFPLLLLLLVRKAKAWASIMIAGLCLGSLMINVLALKFGAYTPAFYLLPTRAWELGAGVLIALLPAKDMQVPRAVAVYGYLGAVLVIYSIAIGSQLPLPFIPESLLVVIGTSLLVYSGSKGKHPVSRLLSWSGLVFVGLISYSLYLWHWPIIVLFKYYLVRDLTLPEMGAAVAVMTVLAILSWRYIERPFRASKITIHAVRYLALAGVIAAASAAGAIIVQSGFPERLNPAAAQINAAVGTNYRCEVSNYLYFDQSRACVLELPSRDPKDAKIVLLGNSHAQMYAPIFRDIIHDLSLTGLLVPANGCLPTYDANINSECIELANRNIDGVIELKSAHVVVLGMSWDRFVVTSDDPDSAPHATEKLLDGLDKTIDRLIAVGKKVVLIGPIATPNWDVASITGRNLAFGRITERPLYSSQQDFQSKFSNIIDHFEQRSDLAFVRPDRVQCRNGHCDYVINGHSLFADDNHLALAELSLFRPVFEIALKQALGSDR